MVSGEEQQPVELAPTGCYNVNRIHQETHQRGPGTGEPGFYLADNKGGGAKFGSSQVQKQKNLPAFFYMGNTMHYNVVNS